MNEEERNIPVKLLAELSSLRRRVTQLEKLEKEYSQLSKSWWESEEKYRLLVEFSPETITICCDGIIQFINNAGPKLFAAKTIDQLIGKPFLNLIHPSYRQIAKTHFQNLEEQKYDSFIELKLIRLDGRSVTVDVTSLHIPWKGRTAVLNILRDITERYEIEEKLKESEARFRSLYNNVNIGLFRCTPDGRILMSNPAMSRIAGFDSFNEYPDLNPTENDTPSEYAVNFFNESMESISGLHDYETSLIRPDGTTVFIRGSAKPVYDQNQDVLYYEGTVEDITEQKKIYEALQKAKNELEQRVKNRTFDLLRTNEKLKLELDRRKQIEKALLESETKFKTLSEKSLVGIFIWQNDRFKYLNPAFASMFGYTKPQLKKKSFKDLIFPEDQSRVSRKLDKLLNGNLVLSHFQFRGSCKDNSMIYLEVHEARILYKNEPAIIGTLIDITHLKKMEIELKEKTTQLEDLNRNLEKRIEEEIQKSRQQEQMLMQHSKLVAMGEMVGAIAHQWRQPLTTIAFIIQNLQAAYEVGKFNPGYLSKSVQDAMTLIKYMSKTIDDFRSFFVISKEKENFDIVKAINESLSLIHIQLASYDIQVGIFASGIDTYSSIAAEGYPNEFKQVILNILSNAKNAILDKKEKDLMAEEKGYINIYIDIEKENIVIKIRNNGVKIPENIMDRIFEPYFTTNEQGKGMGIGLYMSKIIIEKNMGGRLFAQNTTDGAVFFIEIKGELKNEYT